MTGVRLPPRDLRFEAIDDAVGRLHEAVAILVAIEAGDLLGRLPQDVGAAHLHQCGVSLLVTLRRELEGVIDDLNAAEVAGHALARITQSPQAR